MEPVNRSRRLSFPCIRTCFRRAFALVGFLCVVAALVLGIQHQFAHPDIAAFEPAEVGRLEAALWRSYYDEDWGKLGCKTMSVACRQYRFSWWDGSCLAFHSARAAAWFRSRIDDPRCQPELEKYYRIVQGADRTKFNACEAARLELEWWKGRRRNGPGKDYARSIARLTGLLYGIDEKDAMMTASLRAGAMAYRDARRNGKMSEADWVVVGRQLTIAYEALRKETGTQSRCKGMPDRKTGLPVLP